jgi:hypothetical protein
VFGTKPMMTVLERAAAGSADLAGLPAGTMAAFRSALNPDRTKRCTPDDLLQAIAVDALNPQAWVAADNGGAADGDTEAMPPFVESPDNPRTLWQSQDDITGENAIGTRTMPRLSEATQAIGQPDVSATQVIGKQVTSQSDASATQVIAPVDDAETSVLSDALPNVDSTRTMPQSQGTRAMPTGTQVMPQSMPSTQMLPAQNAWNPAEAPTQVDPTIKPALQRIAMRQPPSVIPQATVAAAQQSPAMSFPPVPGMDGPNVAEAPNPADVKRGAMLGRGMLPCALMAIPVAVCGLFSLWTAMAAALLFACALATIGFNTEAQLEREGKRGGEKKSSDWLLRLAGLPWHIVKGFGVAIVRTLIMLAVAALGLSLTTVVLQLPYAVMDTWIFGLTIPMPTLLGGPLSESGLAQAAFCAIGWLVAVAAPGAIVLRLGGGAADYALVLGESILAGGGGYFFFRAEHCNYRRLRCKAAPTGDLVCVLISGSLLLMSLSRLTIFGIAPARIAAVLLILITLRFGSSRLGVTLALCLGFALGLAGQDTMFLLGAYGFSALLAALFDRFASLGCAGAFVLSMGFFSVAANLGHLSVCTFVESAVAGVLLLLLPAAWGDRCTAFFENGADIAPEGSLRQSLVLRLRFAASAMASVSDNVREVREKIDRINGKRGLPPDPEKSDMRMVAADQFYSISDMLSDLAFEFDQAECFDWSVIPH